MAMASGNSIAAVAVVDVATSALVIAASTVIIAVVAPVAVVVAPTMTVIVVVALIGAVVSPISLPAIMVVFRAATGSAICTTAAGVLATLIENVLNAGGNHAQGIFSLSSRQALQLLLLFSAQ